MLRDADCCVTPVLTLQEAMELPHFAQRGMWVDVQTASGRLMKQMALPVQMSDFRFEVRCPAPTQGQHTREVLAGLGLGVADIAGLMQRKVVG
jgi:crotonobetainyl-CoA:carnitine CoA-transferase CaiB-like acyl-CoA transferase